jgi:hypothetical protein
VTNPRHVTLSRVVEPVSRGASQAHTSELELDTLKSSSLLQADVAVSARTSPREIMLWSLAAVMAIIVGVIPALWINRWSDDGVAPAEAKQPQATATDDATDAAEAGEGIEIDEQPAAAATGAAAPRATIKPAAIKASKPTRTRTERAKPAPAPRARKQPAQPPAATTSPPCDVYLHPKGCPR